MKASNLSPLGLSSPRKSVSAISKLLGFSLVEVVLALGVVSFAVIPIMGLIGTSLTSYRGAIQDTVSRQIMSELAANAQQATLEDLRTSSFLTLHFDNEGQPVESGDPLKIYTATVTSAPDSDLLNSTNLFRVTITVAPLDESSAQHTSLRIVPQT
jgi:uncharacterized protein (TIGR02598 family)